MNADAPDSELLRRWIQPDHLGAGLQRAIDAAGLRPHFRYVVLDSFFTDDALRSLRAELGGLTYEPDNPELGYYDSTSSGFAEDSPTRAFLRSPDWRALVSRVTAIDVALSRTYIAARCHPGESHGFWPHSDSNKQVAVFVYLNEEWSAADGGALQVWLPRPVEGPEDHFGEPHWRKHFRREPMEFLNQGAFLTAESTTHGGRSELLNLTLLDQVLPLPNRVVIASLMDELPLVHSIAPSRGRERRGILQWFW